jgi:imidazolonepropionase-like amidohydrolase
MREALVVALVGLRVLTGDGGDLSDATVLIRGERVAEVGRAVAIPPGAQVLELRGSVLTPGLCEPASRLGVVDIDLEPSAVEGTLGPGADPVRAALRVSDTFDPASFAIPVARAGGLTSTVVIPSGGVIQGQSLWAELGKEPRVARDALALHVELRDAGPEAPKPGSRSRAFLRLREALEDARLYRANRGPYIRGELRALSASAADLEVLAQAIDGELPVVFEADRASDLRAVLEIAREHGLRAVVLGAAEGWKLAPELARARVPVLVDPLANLPSGFDTLAARDDHALLLHRAGVRVAFTARGEVHLAHRLRFLAGNAVAQGFTPAEALAAITRVPAEIFGFKDLGVIRRGAWANLVVWNGDPFEPQSWATHVFVRGRPVDLRTRQDLLTERYLRRAD